MTTEASRGLRMFVTGAVVGGLVAATVAITLTNSPAKPATGGAYLALGDSVTFGYREANTIPAPVYADPASFTGYPEDVGSALGLSVTNVACTGETSEQLMAANVASVGCPLHVPYSGSQLSYATSFLASHPDTKLVTLMIGINDVLQCQQHSTDNCAAQLSSVLGPMSANVATILADLRVHYHGTIVVVTYYPLVYQGVDDAAAVDAAVTTVATAAHVRVANGWSAFEDASAGTNHNVCAAGLLTQLVGGGCGIHPSAAGQALLALAVEQAALATTSATTTTTQPPSCPKGQRRLPDGVCVAG